MSLPIKCECPKPLIPKQGISFGGNLNVPGYEESQAFRISYQLKQSSITRNGGRTEFYNATKNINVNQSPRNTFG
jgi:hypothetical protein